ncbi:uncharacterized protein VTP21DRAFT_10314 [Calcarisporiella thermophila]|uniref:uncharacterized protein n=1 Tax=Calcarisporiella thermophila TaxID=911321 RepID=UPI003743598C
MHRFRNVSSRIFRKPRWVDPKDRIQTWNIVKGDEVMIIAGKDKNKTGKVKEVLRDINSVIIENRNLVKKHVPRQPAAPDGYLNNEAPIHVSNVMLLDPVTQRPARVSRRKVNVAEENAEPIYKFRRFVKGTDVEIKKPAKEIYKKEKKDELFSTSSQDALANTYTPSLTEFPFPVEVVKELTNVYKKKIPLPTN